MTGEWERTEANGCPALLLCFHHDSAEFRRLAFSPRLWINRKCVSRTGPPEIVEKPPLTFSFRMLV
jgi:hypothetical protein